MSQPVVMLAQAKAGKLRARLVAEGSEIGRMPPAEFGDYIQREIAKWTQVDRDSNIKID